MNYATMQLMLIVSVIVFGTNRLKTQTDGLHNVSVSTLQGVSFTYLVYDMKRANDGKSLLVLDNHALWNLDPVTKNKQLIAGSTTPGYSEGVGEEAKFNHPAGLLVYPNKAVISDTFNHCLREVDLTSRKTSYLAGVCQQYGLRDGASNHALFYHPHGLLGVYKSGILAADRSNHAMRLIIDGTVSTVVSGATVQYPSYLTKLQEQVFLTTISGLMKIDINSKSIELIAGTQSSKGFSDGPLLSAGFNEALGLIDVAPGQILLVDYTNYRLRLVDLVSKRVSSICSGQRGEIDGNGDVCQLNYPWSVGILGKTVFIGQLGGRIRTMPLHSILVTETCPPAAISHILKYQFEKANIEVGGRNFSLAEGLHRLEIKLPYGTVCYTNVTVIGFAESCPISHIQMTMRLGQKLVRVNISDTIELQVPIGLSKFISELSNGTLCTTTINVIAEEEVCPQSHLDLQLPAGEKSVEVRISGISLHLAVGSQEVQTKLTNGTICSTTINVTSEEICPPPHIDLKLQSGEETVGLHISDADLHLTAGVHEVITRLYNGTACVTRVNVTGEEFCPPSVFNLEIVPGEEFVDFLISNQNLSLSSGRHQIKTRLTNGTLCVTSIQVIEQETCPPSVIELEISPGEDFVEFHISNINLSLTPGSHELKTKLTNGTLCITTVNVTAKEVCPHAHLDLKLLPGERSMEVLISNFILRLTAGSHEVQTKLRNGTLCVTTVNITAEESCPPSHVDLKLLSGADSVEFRVLNIDLRLAPGSHEVQTKLNNGTACITMVNVTDPVELSCPPMQVDLKLQPGAKFVEFEVSDVILPLPSGRHEVKTRLANGTLCMMTVSITDAVTVSCPSHFTVQIPFEESSANVTWRLPKLYGVNESDFRCWDCPPTSQQLTAGIHHFEYSYLLLTQNHTVDCSFEVIVTEFGLHECKTEANLALDKGETKATFDAKARDGRVISVQLSVGVHKFEMMSDSGVICTQTVKVYDNNVTDRAVHLKASYSLDCNRMTEMSYVSLNISLLDKYHSLTRACSECKLPSNPIMAIHCSSGILSVSWKTNIEISLQSPNLSNSTETVLTSQLLKIQQENIQWHSRYLDITVITFNPPIISPLRSIDGLFLHPVIVSTCPLTRMVYNEVDDACYMPASPTVD